MAGNHASTTKRNWDSVATRIYRRKSLWAGCIAAAFVCPAFIASLLTPIKVSGSTSGNHFTITNEAGAVTYYGWFLEPILPLSRWDFGIEKLPAVTKDDWGGFFGMFGLDFFFHFSNLEAAVSHWLIALLLFLVCLIILFVLPPHRIKASEQTGDLKPDNVLS